MKGLDSSPVGVLLPLLSRWADPSARLRALEPFQLLFASLATLSKTPWGGMLLFPMRKGVTFGSWRYSLYVFQR